MKHVKLLDISVSVVDHSDLRIQMGEAARQHYEDNFTEDVFIQRWVTLIRRVAEDDGAGDRSD